MNGTATFCGDEIGAHANFANGPTVVLNALLVPLRPLPSVPVMVTPFAMAEMLTAPLHDPLARAPVAVGVIATGFPPADAESVSAGSAVAMGVPSNVTACTVTAIGPPAICGLKIADTV